MTRNEGMKPPPRWLALILALGLASLSAAEPNTLTEAEKATGWRLLFDGHSLAGWRGFRTDTPGAAWRVTDGVLINGGKTGDLGGARDVER